MPSASTIFFERFRPSSQEQYWELSCYFRHLLLAGDRAARALLRAGVRVRALTAHREAPAMTDAAITADVHQPLDVHRDFGAERALGLDRALDHLAEATDVGIGQVANAACRD